MFEFLSTLFSKEILPRPKYAVCWLDDDEHQQQHPEDDSHPAPVLPHHNSTGRPPPLLSPLVSCDRLTPPSHFQDVRLVALDLGGAAARPGELVARPGDVVARPGDVAARPGDVAYRPGDVAVVQPGNLAEHVTTFFDLFPALDPARRFQLRQLDPNIPLPPRSEPQRKDLTRGPPEFRVGKNPFFFKKTQPSGFFGFFGFFWVFLPRQEGF